MKHVWPNNRTFYIYRFIRFLNYIYAFYVIGVFLNHLKTIMYQSSEQTISLDGFSLVKFLLAMLVIIPNRYFLKNAFGCAIRLLMTSIIAIYFSITPVLLLINGIKSESIIIISFGAIQLVMSWLIPYAVYIQYTQRKDEYHLLSQIPHNNNVGKASSSGRDN